MIIPNDNLGRMEQARRMVLRFLTDHFLEEHYLFHEIEYAGKKLNGMLLLIPNKGIVLLEVGNYQASQIEYVKSKDNLLEFNRGIPAEVTPWKKLQDDLRQLPLYLAELGQLELMQSLSVAVCYPQMTKKEYIDKGLGDLGALMAPPEFSIFADDLSDAESFVVRLRKLFADTTKLDEQTSKERFAKERIVSMAESMYPGFSQLLTQTESASVQHEVVETDEPIEDAVDLYNAVVLYIQGNHLSRGIICCRSESYRQGIREFLTKRRIPVLEDARRYDDNGFLLLLDSEEVPRGAGATHVVLDLCDGKRLERILGSLHEEDAGDVTEHGNTRQGELLAPVHLVDEEIRAQFLQAFIDADVEIDISSPWMSKKVVNASLLSLMENAMKRGVKIKIRYGISHTFASQEDEREVESSEVSKHLMDIYGDYIAEGLLEVKHWNNHYKCVLCDELYMLEGSYNYLSNYNDYTMDPKPFSDGSPFKRDKEEIRYVREVYFGDREHRKSKVFSPVGRYVD